ncbi:hypothetical protein GTQ34_13225 [Muricauda sp. JGD-17]|uniref:Uncharacterized protein n=1 Tax=Flagellimonas ochracea TaxID=2696472 RepID=A0A964TDF7_9FLAO|nr:hypothetical protein [Allomuricauda ochracea]NAY92878.1 hypothetical protein [Allomuricauda ochracea]
MKTHVLINGRCTLLRKLFSTRLSTINSNILVTLNLERIDFFTKECSVFIYNVTSIKIRVSKFWKRISWAGYGWVALIVNECTET